MNVKKRLADALAVLSGRAVAVPKTPPQSMSLREWFEGRPRHVRVRCEEMSLYVPYRDEQSDER